MARNKAAAASLDDLSRFSVDEIRLCKGAARKPITEQQAGIYGLGDQMSAMRTALASTRARFAPSSQT